jgi:hypothetical protein
VGQESSVGKPTRYGLDGPGIESQWKTKFSAPVQTDPGAHPASYTMGTKSFPRAKRSRRGVDHPPPSSAEVKERLQLLTITTYGTSKVLRWVVVASLSLFVRYEYVLCNITCKSRCTLIHCCTVCTMYLWSVLCIYCLYYVSIVCIMYLLSLLDAGLLFT